MALFKYKEKNIYYKNEGSGQAVVLLHGFLENLSMWDEIALELSKTYRVIRLDLPGFGQSDCIKEVHSMQLYALYTHKLLLALHIDDFSIIGHSMGGYAALQLSKLCPEKINHLVLFHSTANADSEKKKKNRDRAIKAVNTKKSSYLKTAIPFLFSKQFQKSCTTHIQKMIKEAETINTLGIKSALIAIREREDLNETLKNLTCKKTYIAGTSDLVLSIQSLKKEALNNGANFVEIENSGHMSHWENSKTVIKKIKKNLRF